MDNITRREALKRMGTSILGLAMAGSIPAIAKVPQAPRKDGKDSFAALAKTNPYPVVYEGPDVVFRKLADHLWIGNGYLVYNESVYIVEGEKRALLIDTGTTMDNLDKIVASITDKPVTVVLTHVHPDHSGSVKWFDEIWMNEADTVNVARSMPNYQGKVHYMKNHQIFDLGGRKIEVFFAPGHTPGSTLFIDEANHFGISGDAFGSTNLLMTMDHQTFLDTAEATLKMMLKKKIYYMLPGHYDGTNAETTKRVYDLTVIAKNVRDGIWKGEKANGGNNGLNRILTYEGVRYNYHED